MYLFHGAIITIAMFTYC